MKNQRTIILTIVVIFIFSINAQSQFLIGGNISYSKYQTNFQNGESDNRSYAFSPQLGYTLKENHLLGFRYTYRNNRSKSISSSTSTTQSNSNSYIFFSRHRKPMNKILNIFGELSLIYSNSSQRSQNSISSSESYAIKNTYGISAAPGMELKLTPKWLLSAKWGILHFQHSIDEYDLNSSKLKSNNFGASLSPENISIGINYLFMLVKEDQEEINTFEK